MSRTALFVLTLLISSFAWSLPAASELASDTYDTQSRLTGYTSPGGNIGYAYDPAGNLTGAQSGTTADDGNGVQVPVGYDLSYDYDSLNRLSTVYRGQEGLDPGATGLAAYTYDANGNLFGVGYANGIQHAYSYNTVNRLTNLAVGRLTGSGDDTTPLLGYGYTLDANGMRTRITELSGRTINHSYDKLLRLTRENITGGQPGDLTGTLNYTYDAASNRTSRTSSGDISALIPDQNHSFTVNDHLTSDTYDANGNTTASQANVTPTQQAGVTDIYSFDNRLIRRTRADGTEIDLIYTPDGHRSFKHVKQGGLTVRQRHYLVDANNPTGYAQVIEEHDSLATSGETLRKVHLYGHDLIATEDHTDPAASPHRHYYSYDGLGSIRAITDEHGLQDELYDYDAYGNLIGFAKYNAATGALEVQDLTDPAFSYASLTSEYLFTGEQWDADLGMYFLRARYLNTATGRFHSMDSYEGRNGEPLTLHKYLYVHGNPVMGTDPSGNIGVFAAVVGYLSQHTVISGLRVAYARAMAVGAINAAIQLRLVLMLRPVHFEIERLASLLKGLNPDGAAKLERLAHEVRGAISKPMVAINTLLPTAVAAYPGIKGGVASGALTVFRLLHINMIASSIVRQAAEAVTYDNGITYFAFSGNVPARRIGAKSFIGYINPGRDLRILNDAIFLSQRGNIEGAATSMREFNDEYKKYNIDGYGSFGSHYPRKRVDYTISSNGITLTPNF